MAVQTLYSGSSASQRGGSIIGSCLGVDQCRSSFWPWIDGCFDFGLFEQALDKIIQYFHCFAFFFSFDRRVDAVYRATAACYYA